MFPGKKLSIVILFLFILTVPSGIGYAAKSVYVISNINDNEIRAYKVNGTSLTYQVTANTTSSSPVGLAIDESEHGEFLFLTFERSNMIEIINAKTMQYVDTVITTSASNLAGMVVDKGKKKI